MAQVSLAPGFYFLRVAKGSDPEGPFQNREEAFQAAGGLDVTGDQEFFIIEAIFDNLGWGH